MLVTQADFEGQVERARAEAVNPAHGLFGPGSMTWRVSRESIVFLGAGRAALLQLAHPFVAHAIREHSATRSDPVGRFNRTFQHVYGIIFGDLDHAIEAGRRVRKVHDHIHGAIDERVGVWSPGDRYRAHDAAALFWVHATLLETSVMAYEIAVAKLTRAEKDQLCREMTRFAWLFGIPDELLPADWAAFAAYCQRMFASPELSVGRPAREIGDFLMNGATGSARPAMRGYRAITAGLLPPRLREEFGIPFGRADALAFEASVATLSRTWRRLPERLRVVPAFVEAKQRLAGKLGPDRFGRAIERSVLRWLEPTR